MKPYFIGIGGPSCSGKTYLARRLAERLGPAQVLALDSYYLDRSSLPMPERARCNFDAPEALDWELLATHLDALGRGEAVQVPIYDFATHCRLRRSIDFVPTTYVIVEGLLALHNSGVLERLDLRIYVDTPDAVCFARRLERDQCERGRTPESIREQYEAFVRPMFERYVLPTRARAGLTVSGVCDVEAPVGQIAKLTRRRSRRLDGACRQALSEDGAARP